jgi:hypothetical protein
MVSKIYSKSCHELVCQLRTSVRPVHHEASVSGLMPMHDMPGISVTVHSMAAATVEAGQWPRNSVSAP